MPDVILPVLNEAGAIADVLARMPAGYRPIVVDNGSTDGSAQVAGGLGVVVIEETQQGFGAACWAGLMAAEDEVVCFMDCDGSLSPADLPLVAAPILEEAADLCIGKRVPEKGAWPLHARVANRLLAAEVRRRAGLALSDLGPMRAARREPLVGLGLADRRFGWPLEMVLKAAEAKWRIVEIPVPYRARSGRSKVTGTAKGTFRTIRDMAQLLK